jgi:two-component system OmpR family response regulator
MAVETEQAPPIHVLLVEDDARTAQLIAELFRRNQVLVTCAADGVEGLRLAARGRFDAVVLDLMLPGRDGLEVCRELRARSDVPIVMLTALGGEVDRILGLELGADDYVVKPFSARELLVRIRNLVRRAKRQLPLSSEKLCVGDLVLDPVELTATIAGRDLALTSLEFALLRVLAERAGRVLSRDQLLQLAHPGSDRVFGRAIDMAIWRLRQKLGDDARRPRLLKTVRGAGYVLILERKGTAP